MGSLPGSERTLRGAIVAVDAASPVSPVIVFQHNPGRDDRAGHPQRPTSGWLTRMC